MKKIFKCDICGKESENQSVIEKCENTHSIEAKRKIMPAEAIICPTCKGKGDYEGNDGCDYRCCYVCGGVGFVIPVEIKTIQYQKIKE